MLFCNSAYAFTEEDNKSVKGIIIDCKKHSYTDLECYEAIITNEYTVPESIICTYLPRLEGCL